MELPPKLTSDLRIIQNQMKLAIQTHQIMRLKQTNDPTNFKIHNDLQEIERKISTLGEKQNQLMRWLRKQLTTNGTLMAKTIATTLGFAVNGSHQRTITAQHKSCNNILVPKTCNSSICSAVKEKIQISMSKVPIEKITEVKTEPKGKSPERVVKFARDANQRNHNTCASIKPVKQFVPTSANGTKKEEVSVRPVEPLTPEKESFLAALGLVTRDVLKELQNKRVERKRRSTANHTQFVYGNSWEMTSKKRKKNNYLASSLKQPVTRQAARAQNPKTDSSQMQNTEQTVLVFKTPLPVTTQIIPQSTDVGNINISSQLPIVKKEVDVSNEDSYDDRLGTSIIQQNSESKFNPAHLCLVCHKNGENTIACSCNMFYHSLCAEKIENCVGCGIKIKSNSDRRAEKQRLQEMNCRLNREKQQLEKRAAELSVFLGNQADEKKNLLATEESVRKKIKQIHDFVSLLKSTQSIPSS